jgi:hypothetical protein
VKNDEPGSLAITILPQKGIGLVQNTSDVLKSPLTKKSKTNSEICTCCERTRTFRFMFGSRIDSNTTKSKYSEACLESPSILPPTSGLKRQVVSQNSLLYGLYRKGTK